jgi:DME family drug/metabolite transporter
MARLLVLAAAVLWGSTGTARALWAEHADPSSVGAARVVVGGVALGVVAWRLRWLDRPSLARAPGALTGAVLTIAAYQPLFFGGVARTGVAVGTVVGIGSAPVFAGALGVVVRGERPAAAWYAATALAVAGTVLLLGRGATHDVDGIGVLMAVGAGASYSAYVACTKAAIDAGGRPEAVAAITFAGAALVLAPVAVAGADDLADGQGLLAVAHLGLVTLAVAYVLFTRGLAGVGVGTAGTLTLAEPATAALLALAVLGERVSTTTFVGLALVGTGLAVAALSGPSTRRRRRAPDP